MDLFLLCFSLSSAASLRNVLSKWSPELKHYAKRAPVLLVGLKADLRKRGDAGCVDTERGLEVAREIGAEAYMECSAKTQEVKIEFNTNESNGVNRKELTKTRIIGYVKSSTWFSGSA